MSLGRVLFRVQVRHSPRHSVNYSRTISNKSWSNYAPAESNCEEQGCGNAAILEGPRTQL